MTSGGYSEAGFWRSLQRGFRSAGAAVSQPALELYYVLASPHTPRWAKSIAVAALAYLILPTDAVPDFLPALGFSDDVVTLTGAVTTLSRFVTADIKRQAGAKAAELFGV